MNRERRCEMLSVAPRDALVSLAERCLAAHKTIATPRPTRSGLVQLQLRDPLTGEPFYLGEVLASEAWANLDGVDGWAMRLGADRLAALAAAVCDAEAEASGPLGEEVARLCTGTAADLVKQDAALEAQLQLTDIRSS